MKELIFFVKNKRNGRKDSLWKTMEKIYFSVCLHITIICANMWEHFRSNPLGLFLRKGVLKICSKSTGEHPCRSVISMKLLCNFIEITLRHGRRRSGVFIVNFVSIVDFEQVNVNWENPFFV